LGISRIAKCADTPKADSESELDALRAKPGQLLAENDLDGALDAERSLVRKYEALLPKDDFRTNTEAQFLSEFTRASKLATKDRQAYLDGRRELNDSNIQRALGDYGEAEKLAMKSLERLTSVLGEDSISVAVALETVGIANLMVQKAETARPFLQRALAVRKTTLGERHPDYSNDLALLGNVYLEEKDFAKAESLFRDAAERERKLFGRRNARYLSVLSSLSASLVAERRLPESEAICRQVISALEETGAQDTSFMASCLFNLSKVEGQYEDFEAECADLQRALSLDERLLPPRSPMTAEILNHYAAVLRKLNRLDEAMQVEARAKAIQTDASGSSDHD
jgi:hypothetical protein